MKKTQGKLERHFETALFNLRFVTIIAVIGAALLSVTMFVRGSIVSLQAVYLFLVELGDLHIGAHDKEVIVPLVISAIDKYLLATVLLIVSMGMYELFVSKLDPASRTEETRPNWLKIASLDDLKNAISKVVLMILIVTFFEEAISMQYQKTLDLLYLSVGILLIAGAVYLTHAKGGHK